MKCSEIMEILEELAPKELACEWDNPGLLAGRGDKEVKTILVAVDATDAVLDQAEEAGADMLLTHHPLIFKPVKSVTDRDFIGRRLLRLIQADCPYYAMHTNFDAAPGCMAALAGGEGATLFVENIFDSRYRHVDELRRMGADIQVAGRAAMVSGVGRLHGAAVRSTDLRGGAALVVAGLGAEGTTRVSGLRHIRRGYQALDRNLSALGAEIREAP